MQRLINISKRPIVLTCNHANLLSNRFHASVVSMTLYPPSSVSLFVSPLVLFCYIVCFQTTTTTRLLYQQQHNIHNNFQNDHQNKRQSRRHNKNYKKTNTKQKKPHAQKLQTISTITITQQSQRITAIMTQQQQHTTTIMTTHPKRHNTQQLQRHRVTWPATCSW